MNKLQLVKVLINLGSTYDLIDKVHDESLDEQVQGTLLDVSVGIIQLAAFSTEVNISELLEDEQVERVIRRAKQEIEQQGLSYAEVVAHKPIYVGVKCGV